MGKRTRGRNRHLVVDTLGLLRGLVTWADKALKVVLQIVERGDDIKGFQVLPRRWVVERTYGWLIRNRWLGRDYERLTDNSETMIKIVMIRLMATRLAGEQVCWSNRIR